ERHGPSEHHRPALSWAMASRSFSDARTARRRRSAFDAATEAASAARFQPASDTLVGFSILSIRLGERQKHRTRHVHSKAAEAPEQRSGQHSRGSATHTAWGPSRSTGLLGSFALGRVLRLPV